MSPATISVTALQNTLPSPSDTYSSTIVAWLSSSIKIRFLGWFITGNVPASRQRADRLALRRSRLGERERRRRLPQRPYSERRSCLDAHQRNVPSAARSTGVTVDFICQARNLYVFSSLFRSDNSGARRPLRKTSWQPAPSTRHGSSLPRRNSGSLIPAEAKRGFRNCRDVGKSPVLIVSRRKTNLAEAGESFAAKFTQPQNVPGQRQPPQIR